MRKSALVIFGLLLAVILAAPVLAQESSAPSLPDYKSWPFHTPVQLPQDDGLVLDGIMYADNIDVLKSDNAVVEAYLDKNDKPAAIQWEQVMTRNVDGLPVKVVVRIYVLENDDYILQTQEEYELEYNTETE